MPNQPISVHASLHERLARINREDNRRRLLEILAIALLAFAGLWGSLPFASELPPVSFWENAYWFPAIAGMVLLSGFAVAAARQEFREGATPSIACP